MNEALLNAKAPSSGKPASITIVGGGTAGWMAANLILQAWPNVKVTLIESSDIGIIGVGEGATPYLKTFFARLNIPEHEWMPACDATYKVGISFENWTGLADYPSYFHPFYSVLDKPTAQAFFQNCGLRRRGVKAHTSPLDFFITGELARQKKAPKLQTNNDAKALGDIDYAYHFDSGKLGQFLKQKAQQKGLQHIIDNVQQAFCYPSGEISHISTDKSGNLHADFFIDCTGFAAKLIHKTLEREYQSYSDNLLNNAAVAIQTPVEQHQKHAVQTRSIAMKNGWMWNIPLTSRQGNGYVYSNNHISASDAETELRAALNISETADIKVKHLNMRIGRLHEHWHKNCLAVGLSQGFIEPLEATALMLTQLTLDQFIQAVDSTSAPISNQADAFNTRLNTTFDGVRDYIVAHYQLSHREDTQYWRDNKYNSSRSKIVDDLKTAWLSGNDVEQVLSAHDEQLVYLRPSWYCILAGMGIFPDATQTRSDTITEEKLSLYTKEVVAKYFV